MILQPKLELVEISESGSISIVRGVETRLIIYVISVCPGIKMGESLLPDLWFYTSTRRTFCLRAICPKCTVSVWSWEYDLFWGAQIIWTWSFMQIDIQLWCSYTLLQVLLVFGRWYPRWKLAMFWWSPCLNHWIWFANDIHDRFSSWYPWFSRVISIKSWVGMS